MQATADLTRRYAELAVDVGINIQPGQLVAINALLEHAPLVRELADAAYRKGARYVDVLYTDQYVRRAMLTHAPEEALTWTPPHLRERLEHLSEERGAYIAVVGDPDPEVFSDLDPRRTGKARMLELAEVSTRQLNERSVNWTIVACPNEGWAKTVLGEADVAGLWDAVAKATRLYDDDPAASWWTRVETLSERAEALNELTLDRLLYKGPGTDLTVGLNPRARWMSAKFETAWGLRHVPNLPTEEVFTSPDLRRTEGVVSSTRPLQMNAEGVTVRDLKVTFEGGKIVDVSATTGAEVVRAQMETDEGAAYLGEVALVDEDSAVGRTGLTFGNTLFDENATSHIAYGTGFAFTVEGASTLSPEEMKAQGLNHSMVHTDFMVGGPEVDIIGVTSEGREVPLIQGDVWRL